MFLIILIISSAFIIGYAPNNFIDYTNLGKNYKYQTITYALWTRDSFDSFTSLLEEKGNPHIITRDLNTLVFYEGKSIAWQTNDYNVIETIRLKPFQDMDIALAYNFSIHPVKIGINLSANNIFDSAGFQYYYLKKKFLQAGITLKY